MFFTDMAGHAEEEVPHKGSWVTPILLKQLLIWPLETGAPCGRSISQRGHGGSVRFSENSGNRATHMEPIARSRFPGSHRRNFHL